MKIVSLLPSATEIVFALGMGDDLAGVTFECDFPPEARGKRVVSSSGLEASADAPDAIDAAVRSATEGGTPLYRLDEAAIAEIDPDVILTQDLCRVCAVPSGDVDEALGRLGCSAEVVSLDPHSLDEVIDDIRRVGDVLGVPEKAAEVTGGLKVRLAAVRESVAGHRTPTVLLLEWVDPPFGAGHWIPDMITTAGGVPLLASPGTRSGELDWGDIAACDADLVLVAPCGFGLEGAVEQAEAIRRRISDWTPVWALDGDAHVVRPGPRLVDGVEVLAAVLHGRAAPAEAARLVP